jgi:F-type H+-transporting ATPase subunit b
MNINLTLLMQAIAFFAFIMFTAKFVWPVLMGKIEARQKQIADGLAAGEEGKHSLQNAEKRVVEVLSEAKARASDIVAQGERQKAETVEHARGEAQAEADRIIAAAKAEIQQEIFRAKEALRSQVADLALAGAAKILRREVDAKAHADLLADIEKRL